MQTRTFFNLPMLTGFLILLLATTVWAVKITAFTDLDTFLSRAKDIVIVEVTSIPPDPRESMDGLYTVDINILAVLKGDKAKGKTTLATIYPLEKGRRYLVSSLGGSVAGTDLLAVPELSLVPLPADLDLKSLEGKALKEQVAMVFQARLAEISATQTKLADEQTLLEKAVVPRGLWAALMVTQPMVTVDRLGNFQVNFVLVNDTGKPLDPKVGSWKLLVNGKVYADSGMLFGNGPRDKRWESLPAGDSLQFGYGMGQAFAKPGTYTISWEGEGFQSTPIEFRVVVDASKAGAPAAASRP